MIFGLKMDEVTALNQVITRFIDADLNADGPFTEEVIRVLADKYSVPEENLEITRFVLNAGARSHKLETEWMNQDFGKARAQIKAVSELSNKLKKALRGLDSSTPNILEHAGLARRFAQSQEIMGYLNQSALAASPCVVRAAPERSDSSNWALDRVSDGIVSFEEIEAMLTDLEIAASESLKMARDGKKGQPEDDSLHDLFLGAYQIWVNFIGKPFTLVWEKGTKEPETAAAQWCVDLARVVDPDATLKNIDTVSRKVRERSKKISSLEELPDFKDNYTKRAGWAD